jgi:uncharacterized protein YrrD
MLKSAKNLKGWRLGARDGEIGHVTDFYFDDESWTIRYLVADTGGWLGGREVLISPHAVLGIEEEPAKLVSVDLTKEQVKGSPPIDKDKPVSRQFEQEYCKYYEWPLYWEGPDLWGAMPAPVVGYVPGAAEQAEKRQTRSGDPHLRSLKEISGYPIHARDGEIGHTADLLFDTEGWAIRYLVVHTGRLWSGKSVLLSPAWVTSVSWEESRIHANLERSTIEHAPAFDDSTPITDEYEARLADYYKIR